MLPARPLALALLLGLVALSGCVSSGDEGDLVAVDGTKEQCVAEGVCGAEAVVDATTGRDLRIDLTADDMLELPTWKIGDVFEQHVYYGSRDTSGEHIVTMVTDDSGSCYQFGTTSQNAASYEATFDLPFLGCIDKDLSTTGFGEDWSWMYEFPLEDGKTWNGGWDFLYNWNSNVIMANTFTLTATYEGKVNVPQLGDFPGFIIVGVDDESGQEILRYNYVPAIGWFSHFWLYDITTDDTSDIVLHMMSMGRSDGFTGTYYIDTAEVLLESFSFAGGALDGDPATQQFTVADDATYMRGFIVPIACAGRADLFLVDPANGQTQYTHEDKGDPQRCQEVDESDPQLFTVYDYHEDAIPGQWTLTGVGAPIGGYFVYLNAITEVAYELTADMLPQIAEPIE